MEDKTTLEYFLSLLDQAESALTGDILEEERAPLQYTVTLKEKPKAKPQEDDFYKLIASCHEYSLYQNRSVFAEVFPSKEPKIMYIVPQAEGASILRPENLAMFLSWQKALKLERAEWALTDLIKCPCQSFDKAGADMCRAYIREEMVRMKPSAIVLLGSDASGYMLRKNDEFDTLRKRRFSVNNIPVYVTYHPSICITNPSKKRDVWEDLKYIAREVGIGDRLAVR